MNSHEEKLARAFLTQRYRERHLREGAIRRSDLWHDIPYQADPRKLFFFPNNLHLPRHVATVLRRFTDAEEGYCISALDEFDGQTVTLAEMPYMEGTLVSVVPGRLAYYEGENSMGLHRSLLIHDPNHRRDAPRIFEEESQAVHDADPRTKKRKRRKK